MPVTTPARRVTVDAASDGQRLDNFLLRETALPRTRVYRLIRKGEVRVDGGRCKPMQKLRAGNEVRIPPLRRDEPDERAGSPPQDMLDRLQSCVVLTRPGLRIINKPSGWASQPGSDIRWSLVELVRAAWGPQWQPAHRLDRATSGCMAIVEGRPAHIAFAAGDWRKQYLAVVHGVGPAQEALWEDALMRRASGQVEVTTADEPGAKLARLQVRTRQQTGPFSWLEITLDTGRMHQIRVQCAARGLPLIGDERYGDRARDRTSFGPRRPRLALHALSLTGEWQGEPVIAQAEPDADFQALQLAMGGALSGQIEQ
ncbi:MAG: RluA family pseudouridine synthase [Oceanococcaceae bacterium]